MNDPAILDWIHQSWLGREMHQVRWLFGASETVHFIGLCFLIGAMLLVDLRLIGVLRFGSMKSALNFTYVAMAGFALNVISGVACFASNPANYYHNPSFRLKMLFILLAGVNVAYFELVERRKVLALAESEAAPWDTKLVAGLSLALWTGVIVLGRFLPITAVGGG